jgi:hypothetical protein
MAHVFKFIVTVETERVSGKFASRDDQSERLVEEIEGMNPGSLDGLGADGESYYDINDWQVEEA